MNTLFDLSGRILAELGGASVIVIGLSAFLGRVWAGRLLAAYKQEHAKELEALKTSYEALNKRVQADLDSRIHVTNLQAETEYRVLWEIWALIATVRSEMVGIRPIVDRLPADNAAKLEIYRTRIVQFSASLAELKKAVYKNSPFFPANIYEQVSKVIRAGHAEEVHVSQACEGKRPINIDWLTAGKTIRTR